MASEETWKFMPNSSSKTLIINMRQANDAERKTKNTVMNRSIYRHQGRTRNSAPSSADPSFSPRKVATLPGALKLFSTQFGISTLADAVCHVVTVYGHGACWYSEVLDTMIDAPQDVAIPYVYRTAYPIASNGLLCPARSSQHEGAAIGPLDTHKLDTHKRVRSSSIHASTDLEGTGNEDTGLCESPRMIFVPHRSYQMLYKDLESVQRVQPVFVDGHLTFRGIDPDYDSAFRPKLSLDDLLLS